jgi:DNA topoisomerase-1
MIKRIGHYTTGFKYFKKYKQQITDENEIEKLRALKIPPAYQDVVIINNKKIIAYGYDSKGRKQVIYHPEFVKKRNAKKYQKIIDSEHLFTKLKNKINRDIKHSDQKTKEIAIIIYLIFHCGFRIGNEKYEKSNQSYGLTTLKFLHLKFDSNCIEFDFIGKKGVRNQSSCKHTYICEYLRSKKITADETDNVFSYVDENNNNKNIRSNDVNDYLKTIDKHIQLTSKDLRTWNANHLFIKFFQDSYKQKQKNPVKHAIDLVAEQLHNTPAICKKSYIDPKIIDHANSIIDQKYM